MSNRPRPLSPHLQVYRFKLHMAMSILHRITGVVLGAGALCLAWWLTALATSEAYFAVFTEVMSHPLGRLGLFAFTASLFYHGLNGVRHLWWDIGKGFEKAEVKRSGILVWVLTIGLTVGVWVLAYMQAGRM